VNLSGSWLQAGRTDARAFAEAFREAPPERRPSIEILQRLSAALASHEFSMVTVDTDTKRQVFFAWSAWRQGLLADPALRGLLASDRGNLERIIDASSGAGRGVSALTDTGSTIVLAVLPRDHASAAIISESLGRYLEDWRQEAAGKRDRIRRDLPRLLEGTPRVVHEYQSALVDMLLRAIVEARVERVGDIVRLTLRVAPTAEEAPVIRRFLASESARVLAAGRVIAAIVQDRDPERTDLMQIGGQELIEAVPRAIQRSAPVNEPQ
jgi:hypothetical protein